MSGQLGKTRQMLLGKSEQNSGNCFSYSSHCELWTVCVCTHTHSQILIILIWISHNKIKAFPFSFRTGKLNWSEATRRPTDWTDEDTTTLLWVLSRRSAWWTPHSFRGRGPWWSSSRLRTSRPRSSWWRRWSLLPGTTTRPPCRLRSRRWPPLEGEENTDVINHNGCVMLILCLYSIVIEIYYIKYCARGHQ